ncbi:MAG: hypothetical protein R2799_14000 [Crocinitomicaceae bacterium]
MLYFTIYGQSTNTTSAAVAYQEAQKQMMYQKFDKSVELLEEAKGLIDKAVSEITPGEKEKVVSKALLQSFDIYGLFPYFWL